MASQRNISPEINNSNVKHFREGKEEGLREGKEEGLREGKEEGLREGLEKGILQVAKNMKAAGVDDAVILATTGLNEDKLNSL
jgi:predicted transposase/invertase (TIGR01784 family)